MDGVFFEALILSLPLWIIVDRLRDICNILTEMCYEDEDEEEDEGGSNAD